MRITNTIGHPDAAADETGTELKFEEKSPVLITFIN
jgi:hypothetical protein